MVKVLVGRTGEELHPFDLEDIKRGAIKESGLFPELFASEWPRFTSGVLISGVERKLAEHRAPLSYGEYDFPLYLPASVITRAFEDSKESEHAQDEIAAGKAHKGFVGPLRAELARLPKKEAEEFAKSIAARAGVPNLNHIVAFADDRNMVSNDNFLDPVYGHLRDHWNPELRQVFEENVEIPGVRVKETDGANYGVANGVYLYDKASEELKLEDPQYRMDTVLHIQPVIPGVLPLPEQGLIIKAIGEPFTRRAISDKDRKKIERGRILTYDHFNEVAIEGFDDIKTVYQLKKRYPQHPYFTEKHSPGVCMTAFAHAVGLPTLVENRKQARPRYTSTVKARIDKPKTVIASSALITDNPSRTEIRSRLAFPEGMKLSYHNAHDGGQLTSLRRLEQYAYSGQAFVVQDPDQFEAKDGPNLTAEQIKLLRRLETDLIYAYLITMSTQSGAPNHIGRAHLVEESYFKSRGLWHPDFCNMALAGDDEKEAFKLYGNAEELLQGLSEWDETTYQHEVQTPANDFMKEDEVKKALGVKDLGFVVGGYGSATTFIDEAYKDAEEIFYELSKLENVTTVDGGGVRSAMLGFKEGALKAVDEGFKVRNIGIRSESDVSPLEGNIKSWIKDRGFDFKESRDKKHLSFANGQMHVLRLQRLLQRQTPIAGLSDVSVYVPGGKGTMVEIALTKLHNALVEFTGKGLFAGYNSNDRKIPLVFVDHEFEYLGQDRGIFDKVLSMDVEHHELLGVHVFKGENRKKEAVDFIKKHAASRGFDLQTQKVKSPSKSASAKKTRSPKPRVTKTPTPS